MRILSIDKPGGWTSFDVVRFIKRKFHEKKVGHLGTLDPMAKGVLPVFLGQATRLIPLFNDADKTYRAVFKFGESTDTFDAEGKVMEFRNLGNLKPESVIKSIYTFLGQQAQQTPAFSATKIKGIPSYKLARQGQIVPVKTKLVTFHELDIETIELPFVQIRINCSKGTYIRTLANDLGLLLKVGAHVTSLERLACGKWFHTSNSVPIEELEKIESENNVPWISPLEVLNHLYTIIGTPEMVSSIKQGRRVEVSSQFSIEGNIKKTDEKEFRLTANPVQTKVVDTCHNLVAIGFLMWDNLSSFFQPTKVFCIENKTFIC